ncbi:MAG: prolyl oligopeptidase family serine peptidase [Acidimicrobiales bacterium]
MTGLRSAAFISAQHEEDDVSNRTYPPARLGDDADDFHGEAVADPYRWLESTDAAETRAWIEAENRLTAAWLAAVPGRQQIAARLSELTDYPRAGVPFERSGRWFQWRNAGLQAQDVLYVMESPSEEGRALLDPNTMSPDGTTAVSWATPSGDGSLLAYFTSVAGSDWQTWHVRDVALGSDLDDVLEWGKFSLASWAKDGSGLYYAAPDPPSPGVEYLEQNRSMRLFFHRLGTGQDEDEIVFEAPGEPDLLPEGKVTDDGRYLVVSIRKGASPGSRVIVLDLERPREGFVALLPGFEAEARVVTNIGQRFLLLTDDSAGRQRIVAIDIGKPDREHWAEVISEADDVLVSAHHLGGRLVCHFLHDACSALRVYSLEGDLLGQIPLPTASALAADRSGDDDAIEGSPASDLVHFELTSFTESGSLWSHDLASGRTELVRPSAADVDTTMFVTEQVFVPSGDGTPIPVWLTRRLDIEADGTAPALLKGYGGFGISLTPKFSVREMVFVERGGLWAMANLRGGGEYGRAWHDAGRLANKQNVFDDCCAVARWLVSSGWSSKDRVAVNGASNGGLLVGACITQHPELFGAAVAEVGVLDMLRFNRFTIGWAWTGDLGDPDDPDQYPWLRSYSPLHHIREGEHYPPTLVLTGDHDDRVVPGHSFKFAAALQAAQGGEGPILIRVETATGHGMGKPTAKRIAEETDVLAFLEAALMAGGASA